MDKEIMEQLQMLVGMIEKLPTRDEMHQAIRESEVRSKTYIDDKVTKRLDSLTDGYKSVHEKQWELEHRMEKLEQVITELQSKIA